MKLSVELTLETEKPLRAGEHWHCSTMWWMSLDGLVPRSACASRYDG